VARSILGTDREKLIISDRFPSYDWIEQHQPCWSHLRRDLQAMIDRNDEGSAIGSELLGSSDRLFHRWHKHRDGEMARSTFLGSARPIRRGVRQALDRGASCASDKTAATCGSLLEGEEHFWTFRVPGIEPTNNAAGRALRHAVLWRNSVGGTASEWGSRFVERVLSVAGTCRQRGWDVLAYPTDYFRAQQFGQRLPSLLTQPTPPIKPSEEGVASCRGVQRGRCTNRTSGEQRRGDADGIPAIRPRLPHRTGTISPTGSTMSQVCGGNHVPVCGPVWHGLR
jgi:transposase